MYEITRCEEREKDGRKYNIVHFFDVDTGSAGNCICSDKYLLKLTQGVKDGKELHAGFNRERKTQFLYLK